MGFVWSAPLPEVEVETGILRGREGFTPNGTRYHAFLGIPYAKPPLGELRFKAPEPAAPWTGVRDASVEGSPCLQPVLTLAELARELSLRNFYGVFKNLPIIVNRYMANFKQSEDCLFLNVFRPVQVNADPDSPASEEALRPVLFWVHGGAFRSGWGTYFSPELFLDKDVLVVSFNYRLGPFGFLSLGTPDAPGNAGLKDQALALRWTYDNIRAFGGDPSAITIYGESAGGVSVHHLSLAPQCKGLFRGTIASSGLAVNHWGTSSRENAQACARALAKKLGIQGSTPGELANGLRAVDASQLYAAASTMDPVMTSMNDEFMWLPVVEDDGPGAFQTEDPLTLIKAGKFGDVPLMTGVTSAEGLTWMWFHDAHNDVTYKNINERKYYFLPSDLREALTPALRDKCVQEILDEYTGGEPFSKDTAVNFIELFGDVWFYTTAVVMAREHVKAASAAGYSNSPLFMYNFDFEGRYNLGRMYLEVKTPDIVAAVRGASHGDDVCYWFNLRILGAVPQPRLEASSPEEVCQERLMTLWTNFVKTGNPTPDGSNANHLPKWTSCDVASMSYMNISDELELNTSNQLFARQGFWEALYLKYTGRPMGALERPRGERGARLTPL